MLDSSAAILASSAAILARIANGLPPRCAWAASRAQRTQAPLES
jgi:hypothetical protein